MDFYGTMLICPVHKAPFEMLADWKYKDGVWYGNGESFPEEICRIGGDAIGIPMHKNE